MQTFHLSLSPRAAEHIIQTLAKEGKPPFLKVGVKPAGCSGLRYQLDFIEQPQAHDCTFEEHGVTVCVAPENMQYLTGTTIDFERSGWNSAFVFKNPNERDRCGCGESFRV